MVFLALNLGRFFRHAVALLSVIAILMKFIPDNLNYGLFIHYWPPFSVGIALTYIHKNKIEFRVNSAFSTTQQLAFMAIAICVAGYLSPTQLHTSPFLFATVFAVFLWFFSGLEKYLQRMKRSRNPDTVLSLLLPGGTQVPEEESKENISAGDEGYSIRVALPELEVAAQACDNLTHRHPTPLYTNADGNKRTI